MGPQLVRQLDGSEHAKERLEVILEVIAGQLSVAAACERLQLSEAMFHQLRNRVLQAGLADLEPRPRGRPTRMTSPAEIENERLATEVESLQEELKLAQLRNELQSVLPHLHGEFEAPEASAAADPAALKKSKAHRRKKLRRKLARKHRPH